MVTAWRKLELIAEIKGSKTHYLCSIAKNAVWNYYRNRKRHFREEPQESPADSMQAGSNVLQDILQKETKRELLLMINSLRPEYAQVLLLYHYYDRSMQEIAELFHINYNTALSWHRRAKQELARMILEEEERCRAESGENKRFGTDGEWDGEWDERGKVKEQ